MILVRGSKRAIGGSWKEDPSGSPQNSSFRSISLCAVITNGEEQLAFLSFALVISNSTSETVVNAIQSPITDLHASRPTRFAYAFHLHSI